MSLLLCWLVLSPLWMKTQLFNILLLILVQTFTYQGLSRISFADLQIEIYVVVSLGVENNIAWTCWLNRSCFFLSEQVYAWMRIVALNSGGNSWVYQLIGCCDSGVLMTSSNYLFNKGSFVWSKIKSCSSATCD